MDELPNFHIPGTETPNEEATSYSSSAEDEGIARAQWVRGLPRD